LLRVFKELADFEGFALMAPALRTRLQGSKVE
jgi:hypothetical protein